MVIFHPFSEMSLNKVVKMIMARNDFR